MVGVPISAVKYLCPMLVFYCVYISFTSTGIWSFSLIIFFFGLVPLLELFVFKADHTNCTAIEEDFRKENIVYDIFLYMYIPLIYWAIWRYFSAVVEPQLD